VYSFAVHLAAVEVDELTGGVEVVRYLAFTDVGRVLNPLTLDQQMHGGIAQGLGYALWEEMPAPEGIIAAPDLATYLIPTALDLPDMETAAIQTFEPSGPYGMKGAGEICIDGPLPATANALAAACGTPLFKAPFTAERVLAALAGKGGEE
jgi:CO/xanthine dehydrogenase Mo-binding subunit